MLVNASSVVAEIYLPCTSANSMRKAAVRALRVSLREELRLEGLGDVQVCTVFPARIDTPFCRHAANYTGCATRPAISTSPAPFRPPREFLVAGPDIAGPSNGGPPEQSY